MQFIRSFIRKHTMGFPIILLVVMFAVETLLSILVSQNLYYFREIQPGYVVRGVTLTSAEDPLRTVPYAQITEVREESEYVRVRITSKAPGTEKINLTVTVQDPSGQIFEYVDKTLLTVTCGVVFLGETLADFTGFPLFFYTMTLYAFFMLLYIEGKRRDLQKTTMYSHRSIIQWAGTFFYSGILVVYGFASLLAILGYRRLHTRLMAAVTQNMMLLLAGFTFPLLFIFSVFLIVSNLALMKHEGKHPANSLGILAGLFLMVGDCAVFLLYIANLKWGTEYVAIAIAYAVCASFLVIFQMLLSSAVLCGLMAAIHRPEYNKDYIIILGCSIRKDGTLYPLIRGRVDAAIAFFYKQKETTGKEAVFVPSGGQGEDEVMAEGTAMQHYLLSKGIPERLILAETESTTTLENMRYSKRLIDTQSQSPQIAFSTTNYHVFRSGIFATEAGMRAEGIGSRTVWYFWPNAFLREVAALFVSQPKLQLAQAILLAIIAGLSGYWRYLAF